MKNSLYIFDFDDCLCQTDSIVKVTTAKGKVYNFTSHEFAEYKMQPGDSLDGSDFSTLHNPRIVHKYFDVFLKIYRAVGNKAVILTARGDEKPIREFLSSQGLTGVPIYALGSKNSASDKKNWIENQIKRGINDILFVDDSKENATAVRSLRAKYPNVKIDVRVATV